VFATGQLTGILASPLLSRLADTSGAMRRGLFVGALGGQIVFLAADAIAGNGVAGGNGGVAVGGRAEVNFNNGGSLLLSGQLSVSANALGGNGVVGGNATAQRRTAPKRC
jgi:hypothetical protein